MGPERELETCPRTQIQMRTLSPEPVLVVLKVTVNGRPGPPRVFRVMMQTW